MDVTFHNAEKEIGKLDFSGDELVFTGEADECAYLFIAAMKRQWAKGNFFVELRDLLTRYDADIDANEGRIEFGIGAAFFVLDGPVTAETVFPGDVHSPGIEPEGRTHDTTLLL